MVTDWVEVTWAFESFRYTFANTIKQPNKGDRLKVKSQVVN